MNAIKFETTIDETVAQAMPKLRPLLGKRVELIALDAELPAGESAPARPQRRKISWDEFLAQRLVRPLGVAPVTLEDMERAMSRFQAGPADFSDYLILDAARMPVPCPYAPSMGASHEKPTSSFSLPSGTAPFGGRPPQLPELLESKHAHDLRLFG